MLQKAKTEEDIQEQKQLKIKKSKTIIDIVQMTPLMSRKLELNSLSPTPILVPRKNESNSLAPPEVLQPARHNTSVNQSRAGSPDLAAIREEIQSDGETSSMTESSSQDDVESQRYDTNRD